MLRPIRTSGLLLAALLASSAMAGAPRPIVAVHPLEVVDGTDKDIKEVQEVFENELGKLNILRADEHAIRGFLGAGLQASCGDDACLQEMAQTVRADKALYVTISLYSPNLIVTARVIAADGRVLWAAPEGSSFDFDKKAPKAKRRVEAAGRAFAQFLPGLQLDRPVPEATPVVTKVEPPPVQVKKGPDPVQVKKGPDPVQVKKGPEGVAGSAGKVEPVEKPLPGDAPLKQPAEAQVKQEPTSRPGPGWMAAVSSWLESTPRARLAGYGLAGGGLVCGAAAGVMALASLSDRAKLDTYLDDQRRVPTTDPEAVALAHSLVVRSRVANGLLIGGGLLMVASATLLLSPPASEPAVETPEFGSEPAPVQAPKPPQVSIAPVAGGAVVIAGGFF